MFLHFDPCELEQLVPDLKQFEEDGQLRLGPKQALEVAMTIGQRAATFFKEYAEKFLETEGKRIFQRFAEEEMRHHDLINRRREESLAAN